MTHSVRHLTIRKTSKDKISIKGFIHDRLQYMKRVIKKRNIYIYLVKKDSFDEYLYDIKIHTLLQMDFRTHTRTTGLWCLRAPE
jgi:hypothetical protein